MMRRAKVARRSSVAPIVLWAASFREEVRHAYDMSGIPREQVCDRRVSLASPQHWIESSPQPHAKCDACLALVVGALERAIRRVKRRRAGR